MSWKEIILLFLRNHLCRLTKIKCDPKLIDWEFVTSRGGEDHVFLSADNDWLSVFLAGNMRAFWPTTLKRYYRHGSFQPIEHESLGSFHWEIMNPTEAGHQWTMKGLIEQLNRTNQSLLEQNSLICEIKDWFDILYKRLPQVIFNSMGMPPIVKRKNIHGKHNAADRKSRKSSNLASLISNYGFYQTQIRNPSPWPTFPVIRRD